MIKNRSSGAGYLYSSKNALNSLRMKTHLLALLTITLSIFIGAIVLKQIPASNPAMIINKLVYTTASSATSIETPSTLAHPSCLCNEKTVLFNQRSVSKPGHYYYESLTTKSDLFKNRHSLKSHYQFVSNSDAIAACNKLEHDFHLEEDAMVPSTVALLY